MRIDVEYVKVNPHAAEVTRVFKGQPEKWMTYELDQAEWIKNGGEYIKVVLKPALTDSYKPEAVIAKAFEIGMSVGASILDSCVKLYVGTPIMEVDTPDGLRYQFWLGVAVKEERGN